MLPQLHKLRYFLLLLTLVLGALLWPGVQQAIQVDNSLTIWFLEDDPALVSYNTFQERFGNDEVIILIVKDKESLLAAKYISAFMQLSQALEQMPEVSGVIGPGNTTITTSSGLMGATTAPLLSPDASEASVRAALAKRPTLQEQLYTPDYTAARFMIVLETVADFDTKRGEILDKVKATIAHHLPENSYHLGGVGIIFAGINTLSQQDFGFFLGIGYLMMFLLILYIYRRLLLLVYALGTVALATYFTLGIYGSLGYRLNLMTTLLPMIIILLGIMDVMHVLNERNLLEHKAKLPQKEAALLALKRVLRPCFFTTLTTMAGFLALVVSPMAILQQFGMFAALGIAFCFLFTYVLGVSILPFSTPAAKATQATGQQLVKLLSYVLRRKPLFAGIALLLALLSIAGIYQLKSDTYTLGYFPQQHPVVQDHEAMEAAWGPYMPLELLVHPAPGKQLSSADVVQAATSFAAAAQKLQGVGQVFGYHSLYLAGLEEQYRERAPRMLRSQFYLDQAHKELTLNYPQLSEQFVHNETQTGRITVFGTMSSASVLNANMDSLMLLANKSFGDLATVTPSGYQPMYATIVQYVTESQVNSLLLALLFVFVLVWLFLRDLRLALLSVVPNFFPILFMLGVMGWFGINLDTATASIAAIVLSFCIDDTIHFVYHYQQRRKKGLGRTAAKVHTMTHVGPAIVLTSAVLFFGYAIMIFGSLKTVELFGILTATAILSALYSQLFIFPLLLQWLDRKQTYISEVQQQG